MDPSTAIQPSPMPAPPPSAPAPSHRQKSAIMRLLEFAASLKVTVYLFALSMVLVFFGTLAQVESGIWDIVRLYFRSVIVFIPLKVLSWYTLSPNSPLAGISIPFPGGWLLGGMLMTNLLAAHIVRFKLKWNRVGIIILHFGIILMMLGEFFTGMYAIESTMLIREGEKVNFVQDNRTPELAVVDATDPQRKTDDIVAIYLPALKPGKINSADLPFDIELLEYHANTKIVRAKAGDDRTVADQGQAKGYSIEPLAIGSGVDTNSKMDIPAAAVRLTTKAGAPLGTFLLSFNLDKTDMVKVDGKDFEISLRPRRSYRDYTVFLDKAEERQHPNLNMAKDFSSFIVLDDPEHGVAQRPVRIYMNAPMRYRGEAFFQANMFTLEDGTKMTGLQVVRNELNLPLLGALPFWMLPYISCIVVAIGMLIHFGAHLVSFLKTRLA